jgi:transposase-like protein
LCRISGYCRSDPTHLDQVFVTLRGEPYLLWRAVDQHGVELDIVLHKRRDKAVAKRFFKRLRDRLRPPSTRAVPVGQFLRTSRPRRKVLGVSIS